MSVVAGTLCLRFKKPKGLNPPNSGVLAYMEHRWPFGENKDGITSVHRCTERETGETPATLTADSERMHPENVRRLNGTRFFLQLNMPSEHPREHAESAAGCD